MSIHRRLLVGLLLGLMTLFAISGSLLYFCMHIVLFRQFDTALAAKAHAISGLIYRQDDGEFEFEFSPESMPEFGPNGLDFFVIRKSNGSVLARSPSLGQSDLPLPSPHWAGPVSCRCRPTERTTGQVDRAASGTGQRGR